jgi:hypothetical protein
MGIPTLGERYWDDRDAIDPREHQGVVEDAHGRFWHTFAVDGSAACMPPS